MFYKIVKNIANIIFRLLYRIEVYGKENIPDNGKLILCANHASNLDPILITIVYPHQISWMAKKELFKNKTLSYLIKKLKAFPVNREGTDVKAIKNALRVLKSEEILGIFPEGTRVKGYDSKNVKQGAVLLSIRSKSPILPVYIESRYKIFSKVKIYIGEPIEYYKRYDKNINSEDYHNISKNLLKTIYNLKNQ